MSTRRERRLSKHKACLVSINFVIVQEGLSNHRGMIQMRSLSYCFLFASWSLLYKALSDFANIASKWNLGLANSVPAPSRGMSFRVTSTFAVVVVWDVEPKSLEISSSFPDRPRRSLICVVMWKWLGTSRKVQNFNKNLLFPIRGFV